MTLSEKDVLHILRLVEESSFDSLQLEYGDTKIAVSKSGNFLPQVAQAPAPVAADAPVAPTPAVQQNTEKQDQSPAPGNVAPQPQASAAATASSSLVAVEAPVVGVFYAAPEPGAEPFVQVGSEVDADTTVGLVEVMKVFNGVSAGLKGRIVEICVEDSQLVEYGQPLFMVEPDGGAG
ncbi:acetyl-CoA carboxylase biotin carboxyl carrier protein [Marinobacter sp. TBZ242]|uniref:Biotin carboxyl carrier protein of acetyl-CoA carboxylase n=1 Tax=Marinobacter azerbaijanicus TaxID=3050455 RepID=A0ABT7IHQ5_9GAMM|nr:acetyl-CoA carboxylase biotin carboxyl carrier protein [Marinobacter sp. TBZ242]MDL0433213.1 acetyl-CoA carboxylase biotin carboxyl carrier protein [Marinobacter sp. TBZ242]